MVPVAGASGGSVAIATRDVPYAADLNCRRPRKGLGGLTLFVWRGPPVRWQSLTWVGCFMEGSLRVLDDAELLLGVSRHLGAYGVTAAHAELDAVQWAGQVYEMAWRLRNSGLSSATRVAAIATEAAIGRRNLLRDVLPTLQQLGWIECHHGPEGALHSVNEFIPPPAELIGAAGRLLDIVLATNVQRSALAILRATTLQPLDEAAALAAAEAVGDEEAAKDALRHLCNIHLVKRVTSDDGRVVYFNPNVWVGHDQQFVEAALRAEDAKAQQHVGALMEEVVQSPGIPQTHVTSTEPRWIDFAVGMGLIQRVVVQTAEDDEQRFLFAPHLGRDPFGVGAGDPSGHVRQLVGSMIYASTFATRNKLRRPGAFLYSLIRDGVAGDVPEIGQDYPMLETAGTIRVIPGSWNNSFSMELLQADVAEEALKILDSRENSTGGEATSPGAIGEQRSYTLLIDPARRGRTHRLGHASATYTTHCATRCPSTRCEKPR